MANKCAIFREKCRRMALRESQLRPEQTRPCPSAGARTSGFLREELRRRGPAADAAKPAAGTESVYWCLYGQMFFD